MIGGRNSIMNKLSGAILLLNFLGTYGQNAGTVTEEQHPTLRIQHCDDSGCHNEQAAFVMSESYRWLYSIADNSTNCQPGGNWDPTLCPDGKTCAENCALNGLSLDQYNNKYGVVTSDSAITINFETKSGQSTNIGAGGYLVTTDEKYRMFKLKNREFTFDVQTSSLPCGLNGAIYLVEMEEDGGMKSYPTNKAGAKYGVGYCDAQCKNSLRFIAGEANIGNEKSVCCIEFDLWEANSASQTFTTHGCKIEGYYPCDGDCGYNCDKPGCAFAAYRLNDRTFYGRNSTFEVDSSSPLTAVTQFITNDGTDDGELVEVRRLFIQNNVVIANARTMYEEIGDYDSISDQFCADYKDFFNEKPYYAEMGGLKDIGRALDRGMALAFSLWEDHTSYMRWLDSIDPPDADPNTPGVVRGPCSVDSGKPEDLEANYPDAAVTFFNIKVGTLNSTFAIY